LIEHFLGSLCQRMQRAVPQLDQSLWTFLTSNDWPGNVRQLRNCLESMLVMSTSDRLSMEDLPRRIFLQKKRARRLQIPIGMTLSELERAAIEQALDHFNDDRRQAAESVGISIRTLQRKLREWASECHQS
jgi:DNA-binding NtrC family response regulator